jgi:hypothetical protein
MYVFKINKGNLHLCSVTKQRFILTQIVTFTGMLRVSACILAILRHVSTKIQYQGCDWPKYRPKQV